MNSFWVCSGLFFLYAVLFNLCSSETDHVNVCCYSTNPNEYTPKCYPCPSNVYKNALMACVNATEMPRNISFKAALCMEKNCQIELPTLAPENTQKASPLMAYLNYIFSQSRTIRSVDNNALDGKDTSRKVHFESEVFTVVQPREVVFADPDYMNTE